MNRTIAIGLSTLVLVPLGAVSASAATSSTPTCTFDRLKTSIASTEGAAGSTYLTLRFKNTGSKTCAILGHAGVSMYKGSSHKQVGLTAAKADDKNKTVILKKGQSADATLRIVQAGNFSSSKCGPTKADGLRIIPPQHYSSVYLPVKLNGCSKNIRLMTINAVRHS